MIACDIGISDCRGSAYDCLRVSRMQLSQRWWLMLVTPVVEELVGKIQNLGLV